MTLIITPDNIDFAEYLAETEPQVKIHPASAWKDDLIAGIRNGHELKGAKLPWGKTHDNIRFRPGEVTLWQGINGHGKSQILGQVVLGFIAQGERSCIASFEMRPISTLRRMLRQVAQNDRPAQAIAERMMDWLEGKLWIYDQLGSVRTDALAAVIRYCAQKLGIQHMIIDSLMKCVRGTDDYNGQKDFVDLLTTLARDNNLHIHLVHHAKKQEDETKPPGKFSASGSHAITDLVDQVLTVWRNKPREKATAELMKFGTPLPEKLRDAPDTMLICDKNRHGEWEGNISLWYHAASLQYTTDSRCKPIDFLGAVA